MLAIPDAMVTGIVSGTAGIAGAVLGQIFGAREARKTLKLQQEHLDGTRFHTERIKLYAQFLGASRDSTSSQESDRVAALDKILEVAPMLRLLASKAVDDAVQQVVSLIIKTRITDSSHEKENSGKINNQENNLLEIMRAELGVASAPQTQVEPYPKPAVTRPGPTSP